MPEPLSLEVGLLHPDDPTQQLILEALHRHREVDDGAPRGDLRRVRRVRQLRRDEEGEAVEHVHLLVAEHDLHDVALLYEVLVEEVVEDRVELLADILDEEGPAEGEGVLEVGAEVLVVERGHLEVVVLLLRLDPDLALALMRES